MARKARLSVTNGIYHVSSRIVNASDMLKDDILKGKMVDWIYNIAEFTGVRVLTWCIMDNHFHLFLHVPEAPKEYWKNPDRAPDAHAFGMRPVECEEPAWTPEGINKHNLPVPPRPEIELKMSDEELLRRIQKLDGKSEKRTNKLRRTWKKLREIGQDETVEEDKQRFLRRMYNLSHYVKTFKERVAAEVKMSYRKHVGHVFEGRFFSGLVEDDQLVKQVVAMYIGYNPYKNGKVDKDDSYRWSSLGQAEHGGPRAMECRDGIEDVWGESYTEALKKIRQVFADDSKHDAESADQSETGKPTRNKLITVRQLVKMRNSAISRGAYIGRSAEFIREVVSMFHKDFPSPSCVSFLKLLHTVDWESGKQLYA